MIKNVTLGADPELFLEKDGEIISAEGLVGGTKDEPKSISKAGHCIQEDNIMVEFNIPPSASSDEFIYHLNFVKEYLVVLASLHKATLNICSSAVLDDKYLQTDQSKRFGCEPDNNVYTKQPNEAPAPNTNLRTAGGHIHIGYDEPTMEISELIVYAMDAVLGLESVCLDKDDQRRTMYGKAGSFRFKDYGVEYRTLSNFWIVDDIVMKWAYDKTMDAIELVNSGLISKVVTEHGENIAKAINTNDRALAIDLRIKVDKLLKNELIKI